MIIVYNPEEKKNEFSMFSISQIHINNSEKWKHFFCF